MEIGFIGSIFLGSTSTISAPKGKKANFANLNNCKPKGIPIIVQQKMRCLHKSSHKNLRNYLRKMLSCCSVSFCIQHLVINLLAPGQSEFPVFPICRFVQISILLQFRKSIIIKLIVYFYETVWYNFFIPGRRRITSETDTGKSRGKTNEKTGFFSSSLCISVSRMHLVWFCISRQLHRWNENSSYRGSESGRRFRQRRASRRP